MTGSHPTAAAGVGLLSRPNATAPVQVRVQERSYYPALTTTLTDWPYDTCLPSSVGVFKAFKAGAPVATVAVSFAAEDLDIQWCRRENGER